MKKPEKHLFHYSSYDDKRDRKYYFKNIYGEEKSYYLGRDSQLITLKCLLCDVHLVQHHGAMESYVDCPSCFKDRFQDVDQILSLHSSYKESIESKKREIKEMEEFNKHIEEKFKDKFREQKLKRIVDGMVESIILKNWDIG